MSHDIPIEIWLLKDTHYQKSFWQVIVLLFLSYASKVDMCIPHLLVHIVGHLFTVLEWEDNSWRIKVAKVFGIAAHVAIFVSLEQKSAYLDSVVLGYNRPSRIQLDVRTGWFRTVLAVFMTCSEGEFVT